MNSTPGNRKLVIVSGRSGSGKSTALHALEDAGFYCVDNLPTALLPQLLSNTSAQGGSLIQHLAVSVDARNPAFDISRFEAVINDLPADLQLEIIYLDADDSTLLRRFSETRRRHPLSNRETSLKEAINAERALLAPIARAASLSLDTSHMSLHELRDLVARSMASQTGNVMLVQLESFGFKRGLPADADIVFDLRCLPNPHWITDLQHQTGRDPDVIRFLEQAPDVGEMLSDISSYLDKWLPRYLGSNRSYVTIAIGCTGGQHRSVYMCEKLLEHLRGDYPRIQVRHRELGA